MRFVCDSCNAQYMISDDKVGAKGAKGVKIKCKKCGHMILVRPAGAAASKDNGASDAPAADTAAAASASNGADGSAAAGLPASVGTPPSEGLFSGVEEDEIGAVFDQVLSSGPHKIPAGEPVGDSSRETKQFAGASVQKLAAAESEPDEPKAAAPANDWFVAIEDRQVGPLTVEKIKEHWDRGEVGPDSLCWRAGFGDWIPLSEATELASVLAPRPAKPVIVAPAEVAPATPSAPVASAFSAGAAAKPARADIPSAPALGSEPTSSGWKPSAASVLASLVKEENDALTKPAPKAAPVEEKPSVGGLLDLPPEPAAPRASPVMAAMAAESAMHAPQPAPMQYAPVAPAPVYAQPAPAYPQPAYAGAGYPQPAYPGYPPPGGAVPQGGGNKTALFAGIGAVGLLLVSAVIFLALRGSGSSDTPTQIAVAPQPAQTAPTPAEPPAKAPATNTAPPAEPNPQGAATPPSSAVVAAAGTQPVANPGTPAAPAAANPPAVTPPPTPPPAVAEVRPAETRTEQPSRTVERETSRPSSRPRAKEEGVATTTSSKTPAKTSSDDGLDDDFDSLFGKPKAQPKTQPGSSSTPTPYIPPEPGGGGKTQDSLAQSDIMAVVLANKPAIVKCVSEQKKRDPDISGKLVMRWVIQTSGRTTGVAVRSEEFKKTYMASCITGLIKGWTFPKHKKQGDPIDFPFTF